MARIKGELNQRNILTGTDENDRIQGGNDIDFINGGAGNDFLLGGGGTDFLNGGDGHDILFGGSGDDWLFGGNGNDRLYGSDGADVMQGGHGNDTIFLTHEDIASGDQGADRFIWRVKENQSISISDFDASEGDSVHLRGTKGLDWEALEGANSTTISFSNGADVTFFGVTSEEIEADPGLFGL